MPRSAPILLTAWCLVGATASAEPAEQVTGGAELQRFHPAAGRGGGFETGSADTLAPGRWAVSLHLDYAHNPLVVVEDGVRVAATVQHNLTAHVGATFGVLDWMELGASVPVVAYQSGNDPLVVPLGAQAVGDLRLDPRLAVFQQWKHGFALALVPTITIPLGGSAALAGDKGIGLRPRVEASVRGRAGFVAGQLEYRVRAVQEVLPGATLGSEGSLRASGGLNVSEEDVLIAEVAGGVALATRSQGIRGNPLELLAGVRHFLSDEWAVDFALGAGIFAAPGVPDYRVVAGVAYGRGLVPHAGGSCRREDPNGTRTLRELGTDTDGDGLDDACDLCPDKAETKNGFQDGDGCPDSDRDGDGLGDANDECPDAAGKAPTGCPDRDGDGLLDRDDHCPDLAGPAPSGCPDRDGDGIYDPDDQCPDQPEDKDGFEDADGCPDPDNDHDGVLDVDDKCPLQAEDKDGFEDADGCPDPDNDQDGVPDEKDKCPNEKETINGFEDDDGCPDKGKTLVVIRGEKIEILDKVFFDLDKDTIQPKSFGLLGQVALTIKAHPEIKRIRVEGHTDDKGAHDHNLDLSQRRAQSVKRFLAESGVATERLDARGFASDRPLVPNTNEKNRSTNRRVEFVIVNDEPAAAVSP